MAPQPEQQARGNIDALLMAAGWHVCDAAAANIHAARGVAIREFLLPRYGLADYLLYVDGKAAGVIEAKKEGVTLTGVETQADKYSKGLPAGLPRYRIRAAITEQGSRVEAGYSVQIRERDTRKKRWEQLDDDFSYDPNQLDRDVQAISTTASIRRTAA